MSKKKGAPSAPKTPAVDPNDLQPGDIVLPDDAPVDDGTPVAVKDQQGRIFNAANQRAAADAIQNLGYSPAAPEEVQAHDRATEERKKYGTAGQQALGLLHEAAGAATFGLLPDTEEDKARRRQLDRDSPILEMGSKMAGALVPALATGGLGEAVAGGAEALAASRAARIGVQAVSDFSGGLSAEAEAANEQSRQIDVGQVAMWTLGGIIGENIIRGGIDSVKSFRNNVLPSARSEAQAFRNGEAFVGKNAREVAPGAYVDSAGNSVRRDLSKEDVASIIGNYDQNVNAARDLGKSSIDSFQDTFNDAHNIGRKADDIRGIIKPSSEAQAKFASDTLDRASEYAETLRSQGNATAAKQVQAHIDNISNATEAAEVNVGLDQLKRTLQKQRKKFATASAISGSDPLGELVSTVDAVETPLRKGLENAKLWGPEVAGKQAEENLQWQSFIKESARVNDALLGPVPGGRDYDGLQKFEAKDDKIVKFLNLDARGQKQVLQSADKMLTAAEKMTEVKSSLGVRAEDMAALTQDIKDMRSFFAQVRDLADAKVQGADLLKSIEKGQDPLAASILHAIPGGRAVHAAADYFREPTIFERENIFSREEARSRVADQLKGRYQAQASAVDAGRAPSPYPHPTDIARTVAELGAQHMTSQTINSDDLAELSAHGRAYIDKSASAFASNGQRPPPLPGPAERFKGTFNTLQDAFEARRGLLQMVAQDPLKLADHIANSFGDLPETHPNMFMKLAGRVQAGLSYMAQNLPPSIGYSMRDPAGLPPSSDAIREFARQWEAVFNPPATIHDLAGGRATPQQMRALQAVHPDLFSTLQTAVVNKMAARLKPPPYESQRYLDQVMQLDGAFSPALGSKVAANIRNSMVVQKPNPMGLKNDKLEVSPTNPRGIASIASGPTTSY